MDAKGRMKYLYETVFSNNRSDEFHEYVAENCSVRVGETVTPVGVDAMKQHMFAVKGTYPDMKMTVVRQHSEGDYVITEFIAEGTHKGEWLGMKPTGKRLTFTGVNVDKVVDGKMVEHSGAMNTFETLFEANIIGPT